MRYFQVRNFDQFQHYKLRNPPWIRLYYKLLHDRRFFRLDDASKYLAIGCFLLASQSENKIPFDEAWIRRELSFDGVFNWEILLENEFITPIDCDASTLLSEASNHACHIITDSSDNSDSSNTEILSFSPKTQKGVVKEEIAILNYWNQQPELMKHRALNGQEKDINKALKKYSPDEIKRAIERYSKVRQNKEGQYRDLYQWTLGEFLSRQNHYNIERFNVDNWEQPFMAMNHTPTPKTHTYARDTIGAEPEGMPEWTEEYRRQVMSLRPKSEI
jgi:hypothetical protein